MEEQFVSYEVAVKLKELGFKEECFAEYSDKGTLLMNYPHECFYGYCDINEYEGVKETKNVLAPLWQQAFDWCLKKIDNNNLSLVVYNDSNIYLSLYEFGQENYMYHFTNYNDLMVKLIELCQK